MNRFEIEEKAGFIYLKYNPSGLIPFPFQDIVADTENLQIIEDDLAANISGVLLMKDNVYYIVTNKNKPEKRKYFTIAHELGHFYLHRDFINKGHIDQEETMDMGKLFRADNAINDSMEREANSFAAALLMPADQVMKIWPLVLDVQACADIFQVSLSAMSIRLEKLGVVSA
jgi:Zn-dependent peptidase ImmA (M78 family)